MPKLSKLPKLQRTSLEMIIHQYEILFIFLKIVNLDILDTLVHFSSFATALLLHSHGFYWLHPGRDHGWIHDTQQAQNATYSCSKENGLQNC